MFLGKNPHTYLTVAANWCITDMSLTWSGSEGGVLCKLHNVLWVLINVLFCQGKASLPLSAADLADCSICSFMSAFLRNFQAKPNLWKFSLVAGFSVGFHFAPSAFDNAKSSQQCPDWYKQVKSWKACEALPSGSIVSPLADLFDQTTHYTTLSLEFFLWGN